MIAGALFITPHAVRQFIARIAPRLTYEQALGAIIRELAAHGGPLRPSASGVALQTRVHGERYSFRAVLMPGEGSQPAVVTILRSGSRRRSPAGEQRQRARRQARRKIRRLPTEIP